MNHTLRYDAYNRSPRCSLKVSQTQTCVLLLLQSPLQTQPTRSDLREFSSPSGTAMADYTACKSTVEWPVAFFWLVCLALNAITLDSGNACSLPAAYAYMFRISPVNCGLDALQMIVSWSTLMFSEHMSLRQAARGVLEARFPGSPNMTEPLSKLRDFKSLRSSVVFVLSVLPQTIKLFATSGIPLLQACGALYLAPWVVVIVLLHITEERPLNRTAPRRPGSLVMWLTSSQIWAGLGILGTIVPIWALTQTTLDGGFPGLMQANVFFLLAPFLTSNFVGLAPDDPFKRSTTFSSAVLFVALIFPTINILATLPVTIWQHTELFGNNTRNGLIYNIFVAIVLAAPACVGWIFSMWSPHFPKWVRRAGRLWCFLITLLQVALSIRFLSSSYDLSESCLPKWLDYLG